MPNMKPKKSIVDTIILQEKRLLDKTEAASTLEALIDDEFIEIASSSQCYCKSDVMQWLLMEDQSIRSGTDFSAMQLSDDIILLTYTSHIQDTPNSPIKKAARSSIWRKKDNRWSMVFHQGTPSQPT